MTRCGSGLAGRDCRLIFRSRNSAALSEPASARQLTLRQPKYSTARAWTVNVTFEHSCTATSPERLRVMYVHESSRFNSHACTDFLQCCHSMLEIAIIRIAQEKLVAPFQPGPLESRCIRFVRRRASRTRSGCADVGEFFPSVAVAELYRG